ncbi:hypothetical protein BRY73_16225 [Ochrobactrum sp. P6BS-III]|uniref:hypothetical protein n=1 Tax=unclassified Ochrobactrum TaxID=239106 RepID=UPI000992C810|nr:5-methylcytosine-specific restriction endonuclease McrA [Ochrobactrum sp. P6BSIII]OOL16016.1 hypothetical protein BRY73_16225 [Ochrobactrum sp. P6BS-III]
MNDENKLPGTRAEARQTGATHYFTGKPCKKGHVAPRFTSSRSCVTCAADRNREWAAENEEHLKAYRKKAYAENRDEILSNWSEWYAENHERELEKKRMRYADNRGAALEYAREYRTANSAKVKAATKKWKLNNTDKIKEDWRTWYSKNGKARDAKRRSTPKGKIDDVISRGIHGELKGKKAGRSWSDLVGYSVDDLMAHLERQFQPGMTWENHGQYGWHIDHIIPRSAFNYEKPEDIDFKRCWALENLQPLWWQDNLSKGAKLTKPFQPSLALAVNDNQPNLKTRGNDKWRN